MTENSALTRLYTTNTNTLDTNKDLLKLALSRFILLVISFGDTNFLVSSKIRIEIKTSLLSLL